MTFAAGLRNVRIAHGDGNFPALMFFPATGEETATVVGPFSLTVASSGLAPGTFPLVVISHGTGSSPLLFRDLGAHLARQGFVVVIPEHPGNNRNDNSLAGTEANLVNRPRHIRSAIDWAFATPEIGRHLRPDAAALIGHSQGGYTALANAGGRPNALPNETKDGQIRAVPVEADPRVKALVLLAPATPWYMHEGSLDAVKVPILMLTGEKDEHAPPAFGEIVLTRMPDKSRIEHHIVPHAGHFSFLSPYPEAMTKPAFPPSQDPKDFDRRQFNPILSEQVASFLRRVI
jgi:predicted dienelactone hydrolase